MVNFRIAFIELTVFSGVYPLASGYMRGMAERDPRLSSSTYAIHSLCVTDVHLERKLDAIEADVYAISCYVWNMGFVRRWLPALLAARPSARVILGGPQVMNHGATYLDPDCERVVVCNREGELTFTNYLAELGSDSPDLQRVKGLSFFRDGELITTEPEQRIQDLDSVPSPYLAGYFDGAPYLWAPLETNRGCPFKCTYCYWGAATNSRVFRLSLDRVKAEITWLARNRTLYLFITDANFGMLKRDIEIAEHIARCKRDYGYPTTVWLSAAKNSPQRMTEVTRIMSREGLISTQPVSLQTLDPVALVSVRRDNIKKSSYLALQEDLRRSELASFVEMIWPLPGETLETFKRGLGELCASDVDAILIHQLLLINNVPMASQQEEHGLVLQDDDDPNSEGKMVVATRTVSRAEHADGLRFGYHLTSLYSLRSLRLVAKHLHSSGRMGFDALVSAFSEYCDRHPEAAYSQKIDSLIGMAAQGRFSANGRVSHAVLHECREEFDRTLADFLAELGVADDEPSRVLFDLDLLSRPHVYSNTPMSRGSGLLEHVEIVAEGRSSLVVRLPQRHAGLALERLGLPNSASRDLEVEYRRTQMPFMANKPLEDNLSYCEAKLHKMGSILPVWTPAHAVAEYPSIPIGRPVADGRPEVGER